MNTDIIQINGTREFDHFNLNSATPKDSVPSPPEGVTGTTSALRKVTCSSVNTAHFLPNPDNFHTPGDDSEPLVKIQEDSLSGEIDDSTQPSSMLVFKLQQQVAEQKKIIEMHEKKYAELEKKYLKSETITNLLLKNPFLYTDDKKLPDILQQASLKNIWKENLSSIIFNDQRCTPQKKSVCKVFTQEFYTHNHKKGYHLELSFFLVNKNKDLGVHLCAIKGDHDSNLHWPLVVDYHVYLKEPEDKKTEKTIKAFQHSETGTLHKPLKKASIPSGIGNYSWININNLSKHTGTTVKKTQLIVNDDITVHLAITNKPHISPSPCPDIL